jgi:hypothetical protein
VTSILRRSSVATAQSTGYAYRVSSRVFRGATRHASQWSSEDRAFGDAVLEKQAYRPDTLALDTQIETKSGAVRVIDCMPPDNVGHYVVRGVEGTLGEVEMTMELVIR